jgi:hypothetical protein
MEEYVTKEMFQGYSKIIKEHHENIKNRVEELESTQKIIIAFYINVSGLSPQKAQERILGAYQALELDKSKNEKYIFVPVNHESRVEVLNPVRLSDEEYKNVEERVLLVEKSVEEILEIKNEKNT